VTHARTCSILVRKGGHVESGVHRAAMAHVHEARGAIRQVDTTGGPFSFRGESVGRLVLVKLVGSSGSLRFKELLHLCLRSKRASGPFCRRRHIE